MIQFPIWPVLQCQCWQTSEIFIAVLPSPPPPLSTTGRRENLALGRKEEEREEQGGSGRRRSKGTALGRWTAYARMGAWRSPDMQRWLQLILILFAHFYKSGDTQAEERFKLNAKVGKKKTRGAKVSMMVMMTQAWQNYQICQYTLCKCQKYGKRRKGTFDDHDGGIWWKGSDTLEAGSCKYG